MQVTCCLLWPLHWKSLPEKKNQVQSLALSLLFSSLLLHPLLYTYHSTGDPPSLVTWCNHSHCLFSYNLVSPLRDPEDVEVEVVEIFPVSEADDAESDVAISPASVSLDESSDCVTTAEDPIEPVAVELAEVYDAAEKDRILMGDAEASSAVKPSDALDADASAAGDIDVTVLINEDTINEGTISEEKVVNDAAVIADAEVTSGDRGAAAEDKPEELVESSETVGVGETVTEKTTLEADDAAGVVAPSSTDKVE